MMNVPAPVINAPTAAATAATSVHFADDSDASAALFASRNEAVARASTRCASACCSHTSASLRPSGLVIRSVASTVRNASSPIGARATHCSTCSIESNLGRNSTLSSFPPKIDSNSRQASESLGMSSLWTTVPTNIAITSGEAV